ncbi:MAG: choice-of-anchor D domain-containing protein [bacterium]
MKCFTNICCVIIVYFFVNNLGAQVTKPTLTEINFLVDGQSVTTTSNGDVTVELKFDRSMNTAVDPVVKFGLSAPYALNVPKKGNGWISPTLWQGFFTVSGNNPETSDGKYIFQISDAVDTNQDTMDTALSTDLNKFLYICRSGELQLSADSLGFGTITLGTSKTLSFTINNLSCADLNISNISVPSPFSLINAPAFTIEGEGSQEITIQFNPSDRVDYSTNLTISSDDRNQGTHTVKLTGSAVGPKIVLSPTSLLSFGKIKVGFSDTKSVTVTNESAASLALSDTLHVTNISTNGSIYTVTPNSLTLPPDSSKTVDVTFTPTEHKLYNGYILSFHSDDLPRALKTIQLNGDASDESPPAEITNLIVNGGGFNGLTNGSSLSICWDNPQDPSGIKEIWWKFATSPVPPQSADDTTSAGGRYILNVGDNCASLRLQGRITSGFWYCYLWLVDGNGNSGWANAVPTSFRYDILPPGKPTLQNRSIAADDWFGSGETFRLTIGIPVDAVRGSRDASEVRWRYKTRPENPASYHNRYVFPTSGAASVQFTVPFNSTDYCGDDELYIWLADSAGNASADSFTVVPYKFDICSFALTGFSTTWSGYAGFTNAENLQFCWTDPNDAGVVSEIRWKLSRTAAAPQSPVDTTEFGGKLALAAGTKCASLPLFSKKLPEGYWYCYIWWVFANGNDASYVSAYQTSFVYDVTPPGMPIFGSQSISATEWFSTKTFKLTIDKPTDVPRGIKDAAEVRWKYQSPPTSESDYPGRFVFTSSLSEGLEFTIPFNDTTLCGEDSLFYWLADSAGNASPDSVAFVKYRFDICPPQITRIYSDTANVAALGQAFHDTLRITDDVGVDTAWVQYRFGGADSEEPPRAIVRIAETDSFVVEIPQAGVTRRGVEYKVVAIDELENEGSGPVRIGLCESDEKWFPVITRIENDFRIDKDGRPVPLINGDEETNYQLFSVPYMLDTSDVMQVIEDDLGAYDDTKWRLFDYDTQNSQFLEGSNARELIPGRAFFIITNLENIVVDSGPGETHRTVCNDTLMVYEGWNLIATPFNFPVSRESLSLINSNSVISLRSYERGWNISEVMDPWKGYALFVTGESDRSNDPIKLVVAPKAVPGRLTKSMAVHTQLRRGEWRIQISARAGSALDLENWAGIDFMAESGFDELELAEPPVIGKFVKVSFPHPEWRLAVDDFSTDIRPAVTSEQVWEFEVQTNQPLTQVELDFQMLGDLPSDVEVHLIDEAHKLAQNVRAKSKYVFRSEKNGSKKMLRLIVGRHEFASSQAGEIALVPEKFALLQNFPNPFNPETSIRYNLPQASKVKVVVYDLLGKKVQTLVNGQQQSAGYYTINWNGKDASGRKVASGVYIYRISTDFFTSAKKMILMK